MAEDTAIAWCDHTFNPWRGCTKLTDGCVNCYAARMSKQNQKLLGQWGSDGRRAHAADAYWKQPSHWDRSAGMCGDRPRVFCGSLMDWAEDKDELLAPRARLFDLIRATPFLDWLLLTKRPKAGLKMLHGLLPDQVGDFGLHNLWLGITAEDSKTLERRLPHLLDMRPYAAQLFVSVEPMLEDLAVPRRFTQVDWVICGGENGPNARFMDLNWAWNLYEMCQAIGIPFFWKGPGESKKNLFQPQLAGLLGDLAKRFPDDE